MKKNILTFEGSIEKRQKPINLEQKHSHLFEHEYEKKINNSKVFIEKNLYITNKNIFNLKKLKFYISDTYMNKPTIKNFIKLFIQFIVSFKKPKDKLESGVWIINNKSENYFHWMTEALTRVLSFNKIDESSTILLPENFKKLEFVSKTLDSLNVDYKFYSNNYLLKVKTLFLTSHTAPAGNYNSKIISNLHFKLNEGHSTTKKRRLWLSRKYSDRRFLLNEDSIVHILEKFEIEVFYPEMHSYSEQVKKYREAEFIGGMHGAALTNMLYMKKSSNVLELRDVNDSHNNCYYSLSASLKINFYYLLCKSDQNGNSSVKSNELENILKKIFEL